MECLSSAGNWNGERLAGADHRPLANHDLTVPVLVVCLDRPPTDEQQVVLVGVSKGHFVDVRAGFAAHVLDAFELQVRWRGVLCFGLGLRLRFCI